MSAEFHCFIQRRPVEAIEIDTATDQLQLGFPPVSDGKKTHRCHLYVPPEQRGLPLNVTFDETYAQLVQFPRLFLEPDGAFVWVGSQVDGKFPWKLDGLLQDGGPTLAYLELKGHCTTKELDAILVTLGWPREHLMFQLAIEGTILPESQFRRCYVQP